MHQIAGKSVWLNIATIDFTVHCYLLVSHSCRLQTDYLPNVEQMVCQKHLKGHACVVDFFIDIN